MRDYWNFNIVQSKERVGYPTQKPLALLERIIKASSNKNDIVFDPFCGCASTCIASERLQRQWIGIDISQKAFDIVRLRLSKEIENDDNLFYENKVIYRTDIPSRTDINKNNKPTTIENKHLLFGLQEGKCKGCNVLFNYRNLTVDPIIAQSKGGSDELNNLQLLCGSCNSIKGNRDMTYLKTKLKDYKIIPL